MGKPILEFGVAGEKQIRRGLSRFGDQVKDLSEPFREIVKAFHEGMGKQFETQGAYGSGGWQALSPDYAARKAVEYPSAGILVRSGLLSESLTGRNPWAIENVEPLRLEVGTKIPYGLYHQKGTSRMPARRLIDLTEEQKREWMRIIQRYLVRQMRESFPEREMTT